VTLGAALATLMLAGWVPVVEGWARAKPAHAWLNLVGFVSLVIATTLLHFFPTVVGARIAAHPSARATVIGLGAGTAAVTAGYWLAIDALVAGGAATALVGALALVVYATRIWRSRARWTSDHGWHRFAIGGLASSIGWFVIGMAILAGRAFVFGAAPAGWAMEPAVAPLVGGWVALAIVASASHLIPAVGPGDHAAHARQRAILGHAPMARLAAWDLGIALLTLSPVLGVPVLAGAATLLVVLAFAGTAFLLVRAVRVGLMPAGPR
jgi:hypothetical protein